MGAPNVSFANGGKVLECVEMMLMLFGRGVRVVRGWGILVLGDQGVRSIVKRFKHYSELLVGVTYRYVLLAGLTYRYVLLAAFR
jgi:hypothetical protein